MLALFVPALLGGLATAMGGLVGRAVISLGIGFVTYKGIDLSISAIKDLATGSIKGLPADIVNFLAFMWIDKAMTVIFSAVVTAMAIRALGGSVKKMVMK